MAIRRHSAPLLLAACLPSIASGDSESVAAINAMGLRRPDGVVLSGAGVHIGQVDVVRAAVPGFDSAGKSHPSIIPIESRNAAGASPAGPDDGLAFSDHGLEVAGVMIGGSGAPTSVAPSASLISAGFTWPVLPDDSELLTAQFIAKRYAFLDERHIRVINHSWGESIVDDEGPYDGNSRVTLGLDWIAAQFDVLNIFAGSYDGAGGAPPDNYNGITVAFADSTHRRVNIRNDNDQMFDAVGDRVSVDLFAPGDEVTIATANGGTRVASGTSIAAPHVTGAVALLNEFSDYQVFIANEPRWDVDNTRKHEVMKAVLLNSADKNVLDEDGNDWDDSDAFHDDMISLDEQMGAGLLDVGRALRQFRSGEYNVFEQIPPIGWDYHETGGVGTVPLTYPFAAPLGGGKVTITLAWDRRVVKFGGLDNTFDPSNVFVGMPVDNLDLFLMPVGWQDLQLDSLPMLRSWSVEDNVEHIYADVQPGNYEIVVFQVSGDEIDYGLAWWTGDAADFDQNGEVNGNDLSKWKSDFENNSGSDADFDTDSDGHDFLVWQRRLGAGSPARPTAEPVPEPSAISCCRLGLAMLCLKGRGRVSRSARATCLLACSLALFASPASAANVSLQRQSRPVSAAEKAGGAPELGMVHDFFVTTDADILALTIDKVLPVYQHPLASQRSAPSPSRVAETPALGASSFFQLPGATLLLGGGFKESVPGSTWGDFEDNGPQSDFHLGRLTTSQAESFVGQLSLRGVVNPIVVPFTMNLPAYGETWSSVATERISLSAEEPRWEPPPVEPPGPDPGDFTTAEFRGAVSIELSRRTRPLTDYEQSYAKKFSYVHEFFVTTSTDLISIGDVTIDAPVFRHEHGSDRKPPNERVLKIWPNATSDSFITTPGNTIGHAGALYGRPIYDPTWLDGEDDGPQEDFLFARLTVGQTGHFSGTINVRGPEGRVSLPFTFVLPGNEADLALIDGEQHFLLTIDPASLEPGQRIPEPAAVWPAILAAITLAPRKSRRSA